MEASLVRRLAHLWGVAPFRIEVWISREDKKLFVRLDGNVPPKHLIEIFERDIRETNSRVRSKMN